MLAAFLRSRWFQPDTPHDIWTMPHATARFAGVSGRVREFPLDAAAAGIREQWTVGPADLLVTATSHYEPFESLLWQAAADSGVPSLAVLDAWMNLEPRFARGRPGFVAALDESQAAALEALGFSDDAILIAGNPWLAEVRRKAVSLGAIDEQRPGGVVRVLFVSEPIASDVASGYNRPFGFDEFDAFALLHSAAVCAARAGQRVELMVRCHPYEDAGAFRRRVQELGAAHGIVVRFSPAEESALACVLWADLICGIGSSLLLEAMVLGRPVISVQPGLIRENVFVASERGWAETLTDAAHGRARLHSLLIDPAARADVLRRHAPLAESADDRAGAGIAEWIERHAASR